MKKTILFIFGTRPEAIKLAPVVTAFKQSQTFNTKVCISSQHSSLLQQALQSFNITIDYNLNIMKKNQSLFDITQNCLNELDTILDKETIDLVIVQGDTSTAFSAALAAFYKQIPVAHIEAGLRTHDTSNPFPEEMNRTLISKLATYHFAPTENNKKQLENEGITKNTWVVGNPVIDALKQTIKHVSNGFTPSINLNSYKDKSIILVTGHRRENYGKPFTELCKELITISKNPNTQIIFPLHLNPMLKNKAEELLGQTNNISLIEPQPYPDFIWLMKQSTLIITDSGGIQEEAPYLGVPVLITRKCTEREEGLSKNCRLVEVDNNALSKKVNTLLTDPSELKKLAITEEIYGSGNSSEQIASILESVL